ncbi:MAG TPA: heparinase II/III family protein, partial [Armatimonadota bacterium]|nr:heparinase II/III family protein [Armatimonadota bacterium]
QWWHWYTCKACGGRLQTKSPTEHACPDCGEVYSGWPYDDVILDREHNNLARAIRDCGLMYVFTGDDAYAAKSREILLGYAERYLNYPLHNIHGEPKKGGGHVCPQTLDESTWLIPVAQGFDCVYDTLSDEDRQTIADRLLLPAAWLIHDHQWGIHNICCWHDSAYGLVGLALGNSDLAAAAINGPKGFRAQIEEGVTDDGFWYESAWGYHFYTMSALQPLAVAARNVGIDLYTDRYKGMYDAPLAFMAPGGALAAFNDSGTANPLGQGRMYEVAYSQWHDPRHLLPIIRTGRRSHETLFLGAEIGEVEPFTLGSTVFPDAGYVILRSGATGAEGADRHIPENYVALDYGPHGGGHGHPDKLGFVLYGKGQLLAEDPGSIAYGNPAHQGWFRQTISHNTVVVDGKSQKACTGELQFSAFADGIGLCSARADGAYDDARLRRSMALVGDRLIDIVLCESDEDATFDLAYHNRGVMASSLPFTDLAEAPEGQGYEWAKTWRSADAGGPWGATWTQDDGPSVALAQAPGASTVLTAIGMGNPTRIKVPFVVSRTTGKSALYCSAVQITDGAPAGDLAVEILAIDGGDADEIPVAVQVTGAGATDVLITNPAGGVVTAGQYELSGQGALLRYSGGALEQLLAVGDSKVSVGGAQLRAAE